MDNQQTDQDIARSSYLGASEVACILGTSPFGDALKVYYTKTHPQSSTPPTERMQVGLDTEDFVLTQFEAKFETKVTHKQCRMIHWMENWAGCTLDGLAEVNGKTSVVEAKTISTSLYLEPPAYYVVQVLWQQWIAGCDQGYLAVWSTKDLAFKAYPIHINDYLPLLTEAVDKCKKFWFDHVAAKVPPERKSIERTSSNDLPEELLDKYCTIQEQMKDLEAQKKDLYQKIFETLGHPQELRAKSDRFQLDLTTQASKRINSKKLEFENPELVQKYIEQNSSQRLVVKRLGVNF